ncbi:unnamed protein product [Rhodiola kirilowii]
MKPMRNFKTSLEKKIRFLEECQSELSKFRLIIEVNKFTSSIKG